MRHIATDVTRSVCPSVSVCVSAGHKRELCKLVEVHIRDIDSGEPNHVSYIMEPGDSPRKWPLLGSYLGTMMPATRCGHSLPVDVPLNGRADQCVRPQARGFLLVFYENHSLKMHRFQREA